MKNKIQLLYSRATGIPKFCFFLSCCAFPLFFTKLYRLFLIVNIKLTASFLPQLKDFFSWIFFARGKSEEWPLEDLQSPLLLPDPTLMSPRKKTGQYVLWLHKNTVDWVFISVNDPGMETICISFDTQP